MIKTALVTGGRKGIGRAVAERLLSEGYEVIVTGSATVNEHLPNPEMSFIAAILFCAVIIFSP